MIENTSTTGQGPAEEIHRAGDAHRRIVTEREHVVAAGYAQGAAMALWLALTQALPIAAVLIVGATHRYLDVLEAYTGDATALRVHFVAGDGEIHVDVIDDACRQLSALGAACTVDLREGLGHVFPTGFEHELPRLLAAMTRIEGSTRALQMFVATPTTSTERTQR